MPPSCAVPPLTTIPSSGRSHPTACTSLGEWLLVLAKTTVPASTAKLRPVLSVVPLRVSVPVPTFVKVDVPLIEPLRVMLPRAADSECLVRDSPSESRRRGAGIDQCPISADAGAG